MRDQGSGACDVESRGEQCWTPCLVPGQVSFWGGFNILSCTTQGLGCSDQKDITPECWYSGKDWGGLNGARAVAKISQLAHYRCKPGWRRLRRCLTLGGTGGARRLTTSPAWWLPRRRRWWWLQSPPARETCRHKQYCRIENLTDINSTCPHFLSKALSFRSTLH